MGAGFDIGEVTSLANFGVGTATHAIRKKGVMVFALYLDLPHILISPAHRPLPLPSIKGNSVLCHLNCSCTAAAVKGSTEATHMGRATEAVKWVVVGVVGFVQGAVTVYLWLRFSK